MIRLHIICLGIFCFLLFNCSSAQESQCIGITCNPATDAKIGLDQDSDKGIAPVIDLGTGTAADLGPGTAADQAPYTHEDISIQQLNQWIKSAKVMTLLDVREDFEYQGGHIKGTQNIAWTSQALHAQYATLDQNKPIVVICRSGNRSNAAAQFLTDKGFSPVYDMLGGMNAWTGAGLPVE